MSTLASPVWDGVSRQVTQPYGPTTLTVEPLLNGVHFHCGIDVAMNTGTKLFSPVAGKVVHVSTALLAITDFVRCYWFVHIDASVVTLSQWVSKGQFVAYSGNKVPSGGNTTGPHLHFEVQNYPGARFNSVGYDANGRRQVVRVSGALDNPATSLNPVPFLAAQFSASGGALEDNDMTDAQYYRLLSAVYGVMLGPDGTVQKDAAGQPIPTPAVATVLAAVAKVPGVDISALKAELDEVLAAELDETGRIKAIEANLNAPRPQA